uniref:Uncharacterized protein n=1 Tax=Graphocephala atropunctata TaxID=36148 RepID=A0A1B6L0Y2_9HEMI
MEEEEKSATSATALDTLQGNVKRSKIGATDAMELATLQRTVTRQQMNPPATTATNRAILLVNVQNQVHAAVVEVEAEAEDLTLLATIVISLATWPETVLKEGGPVMSAVRLDTYPVSAPKMTKDSPFFFLF